MVGKYVVNGELDGLHSQRYC